MFCYEDNQKQNVWKSYINCVNMMAKQMGRNDMDDHGHVMISHNCWFVQVFTKQV